MITLLTLVLGVSSDVSALAVVPLRTRTIDPAKVAVLDTLLVSAVAEATTYRVISPGDVNAMLGLEKAKEAAGCDDLQCAAELAGALGARYLLSGTADVLGDKLVMTLALIDTTETVVVARRRGQSPNDEGRYYEAVDNLVAQAFQAPSASGEQPAAGLAAVAKPAPEGEKWVGGRFLYRFHDSGCAYYDCEEISTTQTVGALVGEYGIPHSSYFATRVRMGGGGVEGVEGDVLGMVAGVSEEARLTLHRTAKGREAIALVGAVNLDALLASYPVLTASVSAGAQVYWLSLSGTIGRQWADNYSVEYYSSATDDEPSTGRVSATGMVVGFEIALTFEL